MTTIRAQRQIAVAERYAQVTAWYAEGLTFDQIGRELGVTRQRAHQLYTRALQTLPAVGINQYRATQQELIRTGIREQLIIARTPSVSPRTKIEAWAGIGKLMEREAKLLGLDAPMRKEITVLTEDAVDNAMRKLAEEHNALAAEAQAAGMDTTGWLDTAT